MDYQAVIFDFDGVLAESLEVKADVFAALFAQFGPGIVEKVVAYHSKWGGVSRFKKFQYYHEELLGIPYTQEDEKRLGDAFSEQVEVRVIESEWVKGAQELLDRLKRTTPMFVVSGTPEDELRRIVKSRGMDKYFEGVFGSPKTKGILIGEILKRHQYDPNRVVMIGDTMTDYNGATEAGIRFVGRLPNMSVNPFPEEVPVYPDMTDLGL